MADTLITTQALAERWGLSVGTLENWRAQKKGPPFVKIGGGSRGSVRYKLADIEEYEKKMARDTARDHA